MSKSSYRGPIVARDDYIPNGSTLPGPGSYGSGAVPLEGRLSNVSSSKRSASIENYKSIGYNGSHSSDIRY